MKLKKYCLLFGVITVILCVTTLSQAQALEPDETMLIAPANPALAGIKVLNVVVAIRPTEPSKSGLDSKSLKAKVESVLEKAGIKIFVPREGVNYDMDISSDLKVSIEILDLGPPPRLASGDAGAGGSPQCVLRVQTSLSRGVCLIEQRNLAFKADVWEAEPVLGIAPLQNISGKVTEMVVSQVETFVQAHAIANTVEGRTPDANDTAPKKLSEAPLPQGITKQSAKSVAEYNYVASKNSGVFHRPNCRSAKRISPENIVGYNNRDDAIKAGKRPCKACSP